MVDLMRMAEAMEKNGFKNVKVSSEFGGFTFQIVGEGKIGLQKLTTLVRIVNQLDETNAMQMAEEYMALRKSMRSMWVGHFFFYVVIADQVRKESITGLAKGFANNKPGFSDELKGGGGTFLIVETVSKQMFPKRSKFGMTRYEAKMRDIINGIL